MIDSILKKIGLKFEDLNTIERETLYSWQEALSKNNITVENIRNYIKVMRDSVEKELTKTNLNSKQDLFLKARLKNYMLLEAYLSTPEKAKEAIERAISGLVSKKNSA
ncbi:MAG: hypothetical protein QXO70_04980 [Candidatus Pacearchaeota archaeon]